MPDCTSLERLKRKKELKNAANGNDNPRSIIRLVNSKVPPEAVPSLPDYSADRKLINRIRSSNDIYSSSKR